VNAGSAFTNGAGCDQGFGVEPPPIVLLLPVLPVLPVLPFGAVLPPDFLVSFFFVVSGEDPVVFPVVEEPVFDGVVPFIVEPVVLPVVVDEPVVSVPIVEPEPALFVTPAGVDGVIVEP